MMKSEGYGSLTWRQIRPFGLLLESISPLLNQDPEAIAFAKDWIDEMVGLSSSHKAKLKGGKKFGLVMRVSFIWTMKITTLPFLSLTLDCAKSKLLTAYLERVWG